MNDKCPCKECLVSPMCQKLCEEYDNYIDYVIMGLCNFRTSPPYNNSQRIGEGNQGSLRLRGLLNGKEKGITIFYNNREILSIYTRHVTSLKTDKQIYPLHRKGRRNEM